MINTLDYNYEYTDSLFEDFLEDNEEEQTLDITQLKNITFQADDDSKIDLLNGFAGIYVYKKDQIEMYVGQAVDLKTRLKAHKNGCKWVSSPEYFSPLHSALRKYGNSAFTISIVEIIERDKLTDKWLNDLEEKYITEYHTFTDRTKYNLTPGGSIGNLCFENATFPIYSEDRQKAVQAYEDLTDLRLALINGKTDELNSCTAIFNDWVKKHKGYYLSKGTQYNINYCLGTYKLSKDDIERLNFKKDPPLCDNGSSVIPNVSNRYSTYKNVPYRYSVQIEGLENSAPHWFLELPFISKYLKLKGINSDSEELTDRKFWKDNKGEKVDTTVSLKKYIITREYYPLKYNEFVELLEEDLKVLENTDPTPVKSYIVVKELESGKRSYYDSIPILVKELIPNDTTKSNTLYRKIRKTLITDQKPSWQDPTFKGITVYLLETYFFLPITNRSIKADERFQLKLASIVD